MARPFRVGDRVKFRVYGDDLVMTVVAIYPGHDFVDLEYQVEGQTRQLGLVTRVLVHADDPDQRYR